MSLKRKYEAEKSEQKEEKTKKTSASIAQEWWRQRLMLTHSTWTYDSHLFWTLDEDFINKTLIYTSVMFERVFIAKGFPFQEAFNIWQLFRTEVIEFMKGIPAYTTDLATAQLHNLFAVCRKDDSVSATDSGLLPIFKLVCDYQGDASDKKEFTNWFNNINQSIPNEDLVNLRLTYSLIFTLYDIQMDSIKINNYLAEMPKNPDEFWDWLLSMNVSPNWFMNIYKQGPHTRDCDLVNNFTGDPLYINTSTRIRNSGCFLRWIHRLVHSSVTFLHPPFYRFDRNTCCLELTAHSHNPSFERRIATEEEAGEMSVEVDRDGDVNMSH